MLNWPDWNKLYANGQCLYFGVPFSDEQWKAIDGAKNESEKNELIRKFREEYLKSIDTVTWEVKKPVKEEKVEEKPIEEESIEDVKPTKKKGK